MFQKRTSGPLYCAREKEGERGRELSRKDLPLFTDLEMKHPIRLLRIDQWNGRERKRTKKTRMKPNHESTRRSTAAVDQEAAIGGKSQRMGMPEKAAGQASCVLTWKAGVVLVAEATNQPARGKLIQTEAGRVVKQRSLYLA